MAIVHLLCWMVLLVHSLCALVIFFFLFFIEFIIRFIKKIQAGQLKYYGEIWICFPLSFFITGDATWIKQRRFEKKTEVTNLMTCMVDVNNQTQQGAGQAQQVVCQTQQPTEAPLPAFLGSILYPKWHHHHHLWCRFPRGRKEKKIKKKVMNFGCAPIKLYIQFNERTNKL